MAKLKMSRIEILSSISDGQSIINIIQRAGVVELMKTETEGLSYLDTSVTTSQFDKYLAVAQDANKALAKYSNTKQSVTAMLNGRTELTVAEFLKRTAEADLVLTVCFEINKKIKKIEDNAAEIIRCHTSYDQIKPWLQSDIPTSCTRIGKQFVFVGVFPKEYDREGILVELAKIAPRAAAVDAEVINSDKSITRAVIISHSCCAAEVESALRSLGFTRPSDPTKHPPEIRAKRLLDRIVQLEQENTEYTEEIKALAQRREEIKFLLDYLNIRKEKYKAIEKLGMTSNVIVITGYAAYKDALRLKKQIEREYPVEFSIIEPDRDEDVPVKLENKRFFSPAENLVGMYSAPTGGDLDPTAFTALFYYFFFGAMLSDAGYGLIMVIAISIILKKFKIEHKLRESLKMFFWCGVSTVIWGALYGSWFGDIINVVRESFFGLPPVRLYLWVDPLNDLLGVMVCCFGFGLVHLFAGYAIKGYMLLKSKDIFGAFAETIPIYVLVLGAAPIFCGLFIEVPEFFKNISPYAIAVGAILVIATGGRESKTIVGKIGSGLYALYNVLAGFLGDILSYSRLLALGLSTGVIASVINMMGVMVDNVVARIILLSVVFVLGHGANLLINLIGAYVHALRLQFVEFFPKFYEGGGRFLKPLEIKTQFFKFKEEVLNG